MDKQTGGPAFPEHLAVTPMGDTYSGETGMTLRDYFAAKAINGYLSDTNCRGTFAELAKHAYSMADAMLAERSKP